MQVKVCSGIVTKPSAQLQFALEICRRAGEIAMRHFDSDIAVEMKDDDSPVTIADQQCERLIREAISQEFPDDGILGEEEGESEACLNARRKWIVDPIDGTYNYARGIPIFSTLLALEQDGEIVLGVVHAPALGHSYWAELGCGAWKNGQPIKVSTQTDFARSQFSFGSLSRILQSELCPGFMQLVRSTYRQRGLGDYLNFALVFEGKSEAVLEMGVKPWDLAPLKIIALEAGGTYNDLQGGDSIYTGKCLVTNGHLQRQYLDTLLGKT